MATGPDDRNRPATVTSQYRWHDREHFRHADDDDEYRSPDVIRRDIDRTRAQLDQTVDALQARLSPQHFVHRLFETAKDNAGEIVQRTLGTLRDNPMPTALIGVGLIWLLVSQAHAKTGSRSKRYVYDEYEVDDVGCPPV